MARIIYEAREREDRQREELITVLGTKNRTSKISAVCRKIRSGDPFPVPSLEWRLEEEKKRREKERERRQRRRKKKRRIGALDLEKVQFRASGRSRGRGERIETRKRVERPSDRMDIFTFCTTMPSAHARRCRIPASPLLTTPFLNSIFVSNFLRCSSILHHMESFNI